MVQFTSLPALKVLIAETDSLLAYLKSNPTISQTLDSNCCVRLTLYIVLHYVSVSVSVLVGLYEEPDRPPNAVDYIKRYMGAPTGVDVEALRR